VDFGVQRLQKCEQILAHRIAQAAISLQTGKIGAAGAVSSRPRPALAKWSSSYGIRFLFARLGGSKVDEADVKFNRFKFLNRLNI
jgi:hypothetical protein